MIDMSLRHIYEFKIPQQINIKIYEKLLSESFETYINNFNIALI